MLFGFDLNQGLRWLRLSLQKKAGEPGFEPRSTVPKTVVLPLHHSPVERYLVQLGVNMYPVVQPAAQLLKVLRPACITYYGLLLRNTSSEAG